ncbi:chromate transporter [Paenibacillus sp. NRS-1760]|uniref:chromate transporter n=1 Tax=Paenibacillus sp. NRS-1760 TaxID=3233902 RepID=UPI003D29990C
MKTEKVVLWTIFLTFLKIGPVTFGGGYAMIPVIEREVVEKRKWLETRDIADIFAVAESIPGAIGINSATFIGYRVAGIRGALAVGLQHRRSLSS